MNIKNKNGMTLVEIIVASMIASIILMGITANDYAVRHAEQTISRKSLVVMRTSAMMIHITSNLNRMTGYRTNEGLNIINDNAYCIRRDNEGTPNSIEDDDWFCYDRDTDDGEIHYCPDENAATLCPAGVVIGKATYLDISNNFSNDEDIASNHEFNYSLNIASYFDVANAISEEENNVDLCATPNGDTDVDLLDNPRHCSQTYVKPTAHSY